VTTRVALADSKIASRPISVALAATDIRDVVHKRLLRKAPAQEIALRTYSKGTVLTQALRLRLVGHHEEDFLEVYPMLPGHVDLLMQ